jgi:hypothetical protein
MSQTFIIKAGDSKQVALAIEAIRWLPVETDWEVTIEKYKKKRSNGQNSLIWASLLNDFSNQVIIDGRSFSTNVWHEMLKELHLPEIPIPGETLKNYVKWFEMPDGTRRLKGSTTQLTTLGFSNYMERCFSYGAQELEIRFSANPKDYS